MGFEWEGGRSIMDLLDAGPVDATARRIAERVQEYLLDRVKAHTPIGKAPPDVDDSTFVEERGGRVPGSLRDSWEEGEVEVITTERVRVTVLTHDPVAPHVEFPTRPHVIRAKQPGGILRFRDAQSGAVLFATEVHHPGTEGSYMMAKALAETAAYWPVLAREELLQWERRQVDAG